MKQGELLVSLQTKLQKILENKTNPGEKKTQFLIKQEGVVKQSSEKNRKLKEKVGVVNLDVF